MTTPDIEELIFKLRSAARHDSVFGDDIRKHTSEQAADLLQSQAERIRLDKSHIEMLERMAEKMIGERDTLRAQLAEIEKTEPVAQYAHYPDQPMPADVTNSIRKTERIKMTNQTVTLDTEVVEQLVVDKAWAQFCGLMGEKSPYPGMIQAFEQHYGQSFKDKDWRNEASVWAQGWQAATRYAKETTMTTLQEALKKLETQHQAIADIRDDLAFRQRFAIDEIGRAIDSLRTALAQQGEPVSGQSKFSVESRWAPCDVAHVRMVLKNPQKWKDYEVRYLYTASPAPQAQEPAPQSAQDGHYPINGSVWFRKSTGEWVLELSGSINGTSFVSRHTQPAETLPEDVPSLSTIYTPVAQPVAQPIRELTDAELFRIQYDLQYSKDGFSPIPFARAVLKKARE